jgi:hypothetical protein
VTSLKYLRFLKDKLETPYVVSYFLNRLGVVPVSSFFEWRQAGSTVLGRHGARPRSAGSLRWTKAKGVVISVRRLRRRERRAP